jgi:SAM-dependent methyltransferase
MSADVLTFRTGPPRDEWRHYEAPELSMVAIPKPGTSGDPAVQYWDRGVDLVPHMTGAVAVLDGRDIVDTCARLNVALPLNGRVLDIGCGTARLQRFCQAYIGLDISPSAVLYAQRRGISAHLIHGYGPSALDGWLGGCEWICAFSVFTHMPFEERHDYLEAFHRVAPQLLVDIIPGDGSGDIARWSADVPTFEQDLQDTGWQVVSVAERTSPDGHSTHRYYHGRHL